MQRFVNLQRIAAAWCCDQFRFRSEIGDRTAIALLCVPSSCRIDQNLPCRQCNHVHHMAPTLPFTGLAKHAHQRLMREFGRRQRRISMCGELPARDRTHLVIMQSQDPVVGMIGLLEAAANYDAAKGASFETYAGIRIRGAMIDEVRRGDWSPRSVYAMPWNLPDLFPANAWNNSMPNRGYSA